MQTSTEPTLKSRLSRDDIIVAPGAYDALSARMAAQAGFDAVYMTGFGVAGSLLGVPDVGLVSATEMADRARALASAASPVPLIADADNGHGGALNVARMTRLYERAGVQGLQLEDQVFPKRCGHMASKEIVPLEDMLDKIRAVIDTRVSHDFLLVARTDARDVTGFDEALRRGEAFLKAGADLLFIEAPNSIEELEKVASEFRGAKLVANMVEDGRTPFLTPVDLEKLGFALALYPVSALLSVSAVLQDLFTEFRSAGMLPADRKRLKFQDYNTAMGLHDLLPSAVGPVAGEPKSSDN